MPMMSVPQWTNQLTNAKYIIDAWHVGVRVKVNEKEIATKKEIERCTWEVMEKEMGNGIRRTPDKGKELVKMTLDEGGSSNKEYWRFYNKTCKQVQ